MYRIYFFILLFIYMFDVPITIDNNVFYGSIVVGLICFLFLCSKKIYLYEYKKLLFGRYHLSILLSIMLVAIYSVLSTIINGSGDYAYVRLCIHMVINIEIGVLLFGLFKAYRIENKVFSYIIYAFVVQAMIQMLSFLFASFNKLMNVFRSPTTLEYAKLYDGYRGLSISGSSFFGLAIIYGLLFVIVAYYKNWWNDKSIVVRIGVLVLFVIAGISAGRSSLFGVFFALIFIVCKKLFYGSRQVIINKKLIIVSLFFLLALPLSFLILKEISIENDSVKAFMYYITSFLEGFYNGEGFRSSTSGQSLFQSLEYRLSFKQFMFGDGRYVGIDGGANYMHQDSGFIRNLLLFGVGGLLLLFLTQYFMWRPCLEKKDERKIFAIVICVMALVYHIKGEVVGISIEFQSLSLLLCFALTNCKQSDDQCCNRVKHYINNNSEVK